MPPKKDKSPSPSTTSSTPEELTAAHFLDYLKLQDSRQQQEDAQRQQETALMTQTLQAVLAHLTSLSPAQPTLQPGTSSPTGTTTSAPSTGTTTSAPSSGTTISTSQAIISSSTSPTVVLPTGSIQSSVPGIPTKIPGIPLPNPLSADATL